MNPRERYHGLCDAGLYAFGVRALPGDPSGAAVLALRPATTAAAGN